MDGRGGGRRDLAPPAARTGEPSGGGRRWNYWEEDEVSLTGAGGEANGPAATATAGRVQRGSRESPGSARKAKRASDGDEEARGWDDEGTARGKRRHAFEAGTAVPAAWERE